MKAKSNTMPRRIRLVVLFVSLASAAQVFGQSGGDFDITWHTMDGGGHLGSVGGIFELGGTIGQPDAAYAAGGDFELNGGFWSAVPECYCLSDVNQDGSVDGGDVQNFVDCVLTASVTCACADVDTNGTLDLNDVSTFVADLLSGSSCP